MSAIIIPIGVGLAAFMVAALGLWLVASLVLAAASTSLLQFLPLYVIVPSLAIAGYVTAKRTHTSYTRRRIVMGFMAGFIAGMITMTIGGTSIPLLGKAAISVGFGAISVLGALIASRRMARA